MRLIEDDLLGALTIWLEARGEPFEGQIAVGEVIRARMARRYASDGTVAGTCLRPKQFSGWDEIARVQAVQLEADDPALQSCMAAWMVSATSAYVPGALLYLNVELTRALRGGSLPPWAADPADSKRLDARLLVAVIGRHTFLRAKPDDPGVAEAGLRSLREGPA